MIYGLPWIMMFWLRVWGFGESPHEWPKTRYSRQPLYHFISSQRPVTRRLGVFFDLCQNKWLKKQSIRRIFETQSPSLWHHCNEHHYCKYHWHYNLQNSFFRLKIDGINSFGYVTLLIIIAITLMTEINSHDIAFDNGAFRIYLHCDPSYY